MHTKGISSCTLEKTSHEVIDMWMRLIAHMFLCLCIWVHMCVWLYDPVVLGLVRDSPSNSVYLQVSPMNLHAFALTVLGLQASAMKSGFIFVNLHNDLQTTFFSIDANNQT